MAVTLSLSDSSIAIALRAFLQSVLPDGIEVVQAQVNRVPPPPAANFVYFTPVTRARLSTNRDSYAEAIVQGSITGTVMTVTATLDGSMEPGCALAGDGIAPLSSIVAIIDGTPGAETWRITPSQTVAPGLIFAGSAKLLQPTELTYQVEAYGPASADMIQIISTVWRDEFACVGLDLYGQGMQPLYASVPRQMPFWSGEMQTINRWMIDLALQANPVVRVPQQFAGVATVGLVEVDTTYPPGET
jgi:hypothetical protein